MYIITILISNNVTTIIVHCITHIIIIKDIIDGIIIMSAQKRLFRDPNPRISIKLTCPA